MKKRDLLIGGALLLGAALLWFLAKKVQGCGSSGKKPPSRKVTRDDRREDRELADQKRDELRQRIKWPDKALRTLVGKVTGPDGTPVAAAMIRVVLPGGGLRLGRAGADGRYQVIGVPREAERLEASAKGYETKIFNKLRFPAAPRVRWDVTLQPAEGIHGIVLSGNKPATGALVWLTRGQGRRRRGALGRTRTDLSGRFSLRLPRDPQGPFTVKAFHAQHGRGSVTVDGPGEVTIKLPGGGFVEGRVVDDQGRPVRQFSLSASTLARRLGGYGAQSFDSADGTFRLGPLAAGVHRIYAVAPGHQPATSRRVRVRTGETTSGVTLTLKASGEVYGTVSDARTGDPIAGALVTPAEWRARALADSVGASTDAQGRYVLKSVPGRRTSLRVSAEGYQPLLAGGVDSAPGDRVERNFKLTKISQGEKPQGELTGIGAVLRKTRGGIRILNLIRGGPASDSLARGDLVVMVGDLDATRASLGEVAQAIRGEVGTDVVLWVRQGGRGEPVRVVLTRDRVKLPRRIRRR